MKPSRPESPSHTTRRTIDTLKDTWNDLERRMRQRMRIYPRKKRTAPRPASSGDLLAMMARSGNPEGEPKTDNLLEEGIEQREETRRKPIISINGQDVDEREINQDRAA